MSGTFNSITAAWLLVAFECESRSSILCFCILNKHRFLHWTSVRRQHVHFRIYFDVHVAGCSSVPCTSFSADMFILKFCMEWEAGGNCKHIPKMLFFSKRAARARMHLWKSCCRRQEKGLFDFIICVFCLYFTYRSLQKEIWEQGICQNIQKVKLS